MQDTDDSQAYDRESDIKIGHGLLAAVLLMVTHGWFQ
jgi:hypothetical protein